MTRRRILGVTGSRAEFGLLRPVFKAIAARGDLELKVGVGGSHLLPPARTREEVAAEFPISVELPMQEPGKTGRIEDAKAFARGAKYCARAVEALAPDCVLVLGDRIEALAAATAGAIAGVRVAHVHGGDRAEGVADESMRHAITKLAHLHFPATRESAERIERMGEEANDIHCVGSPAIDGIESIAPLDEASFAELGRPEFLVLLHPEGGADLAERTRAAALIDTCRALGRTLVLFPNFDPGRDGIIAAIEATRVKSIPHLTRPDFIGLLRRVHVLAGNSSAGLIEAAALRVRVLNLGARQGGRQRGANVVDEPSWEPGALAAGLAKAIALPEPPAAHPYGDGTAGLRVARVLAGPEFLAARIRKRNTY